MRAPLVLLLLCSCGNAGLTIAMVEQNNSGQNGTATLLETPAGVDVTVTIQQSAVMLRQNAHVHEGRCDDVRTIVFGISQVDAGTTTFEGATVKFHQVIVGLQLDKLTDGNHVINVHDARDNSLYVSCGEIK